MSGTSAKTTGMPRCLKCFSVKSPPGCQVATRQVPHKKYGRWSIGPSARGVPKNRAQQKKNKEYIGLIRNFSRCFLKKIRGLKLRFLAFPEGPGGFRELREAYRNHFHLSWYLLVPGITSYSQKPWGELCRSSPVYINVITYELNHGENCCSK